MPPKKSAKEATEKTVAEPKKAAATKAPAKKAAAKAAPAPSHQQIAHLAERFWHERGCPHGSPEVDWTRAEHDLRQHKG